MGCSHSTGVEDEGGLINKFIDSEIAVSEKEKRNEVKVLLLGTGESGKSTIQKQFRRTYSNFTLEERKSYRNIILSNTISSMQAVLESLALLGLSLVGNHYLSANLILDINPDEEDLPVSRKAIREALSNLLEDPAVRESMNMQGQFSTINNSASYLFDQIYRSLSDDFIPTDSDIIRARVRTTGIIETCFVIDNLRYRLCDVGGQVSERRKWINAFEGVNVLLFVVAISEYDEVLLEDPTASKLQESMSLFENISNSLWFRKNTTMILLLNKVDLLRQKLPRSSLKAACPNYQGDDNDFAQACKFLAGEFTRLFKQPTRPLYKHFTSAIDGDKMKIVILAINDQFLRDGLEVSGLI